MRGMDNSGTADRIARGLVAALKSGEIPTINWEMIEAACDAALMLNGLLRETFVVRTTRRVIELTTDVELTW
jgi:hypothetical protein